MKSEKLFSAALFDELDTIYPDTDCADGQQTLAVTAASGTYPGVQIMLQDLTPGQAVSFSVSMTNRSSRPKNWKLFSMKAVPVEYNTSTHDRTELVWGEDYNPDTIRRAPFLVYEILKPILNIEMAQYSAQAYVFRFQSCAEQHQVTSYEIHITHCGVTKTLVLAAEEYPVKVPAIGKDTHKYVNWISFDNIAGYHHVQKWSPEYNALVRKYMRAAAYTRQNMIAVGSGEYIDRTGDGRAVFSEEHLAMILDCAEKAGMYWIQGFALTRRGDPAKGEAAIVNDADGKAVPGEGEESLRQLSRQLYAFIRKHHLEDRWIQSILDEPSEDLAVPYNTAAAIVHQEMPGIPIMEPNSTMEPLVGSINIWCPPVNAYENNLKFYTGRIEAGDRLFVYTCLNPGGKFCNRLLDMEKLRQVYIGWGSAAFPWIEGYLHWGGNKYRGCNPYEMSCVEEPDISDYTINRDMILPAGDAYIFYPGEYGAVYTGARAEAHRIGFEDLELLRQSAAKDAEYTGRLIAKLFRNYHDYDTHIDHYRAVKKELLDFLDKK